MNSHVKSELYLARMKRIGSLGRKLGVQNKAKECLKRSKRTLNWGHQEMRDLVLVLK